MKGVCFTSKGIYIFLLEYLLNKIHIPCKSSRNLSFLCQYMTWLYPCKISGRQAKSLWVSHLRSLCVCSVSHKTDRATSLLASPVALM